MDPLASLIGQSPGMLAIQAHVRRLLSLVATAQRIPPVLLRGETGTGKGLLARSLHAASPRAKGRFVSVNCAAIPETLIEAELFGFERGAFTDARQAKPGLFQEAHGGTLFLDEAGLLPPGLQAKLLTALDDRAVRRLGGTRTEPTDCWIIAATSADLEAARRDRRFREDLYHRLSVFTVCLPPLRERGDDILRLADALLGRVCSDYGLPPRTLDRSAYATLARYAWPGNVRELANVLERAALLSEESLISADMLGLPGDQDRRDGDEEPPEPDHRPSSDLRGSLDELERSRLRDALERAHWNVALAAEMLGVPRNTLRYRIEKHGLTRPDEPVPRRTLRSRVNQSASDGTAETRQGPESSMARGSPALTSAAASAPRRRAVSFLRVSLAVAGTPSSSSLTIQPLRVITQKIELFGGRILQQADGEIDAAFGLEPIEDAPVRAAGAALAVRRLAERAGEERPGITFRIAIETVSCLVMESAPGETCLSPDSFREVQRVLAGLMDRTEPDAAVVGPGAAPYLERQFSLATHAGPGKPPGALLVRRDPEISARDPSSGPALSPFVGRTQELTFLTLRVSQVATTGRGHILNLMGEAGMGKSRLLAELRRSLVAQGTPVLEAHCASGAKESPCSLLTDLLRRAWRLDDHATPAAVASTVEGHLAQLGLADCGQDIRALLGLPSKALARPPLEAVKTRIFNACRHLVFAAAHATPLVLFLEDLHWADPMSDEFVGLLVDSLPGMPVLVVATARPGYRASWLDRSWASQLALPPLSLEASREIVRTLCPTLTPAESDALVHRAGGNPFFLEALTTMARSAGAADAAAFPTADAQSGSWTT